MTDPLEQATKLRAERNWSEAATAYALAFENASGMERSTAAEGHGQSLRHLGRLDEAKTVLLSAIQADPENGNLLNELSTVLDFRGDWPEALSVASRLVEVYPSRAIAFSKLGRAYSYLGDRFNAKRAFQRCLELATQARLPDVINEIERNLAKTATPLSSKYTYVSGANNLGLFFHQTADGEYLTKPAWLGVGTRREVLFYKTIGKNLSQLNQHIPKFITNFAIKDINFLTLEALDIDSTTSVTVPEAVTLSRNISSAKREHLGESYSQPDYQFNMSFRKASLLQFFTKINDPSYIRMVRDKFENLSTEHPCMSKAFDCIDTVTDLILSKKHYEELDRGMHFSLIHGDFNQKNLVKMTDGTVMAIDWTNFSVGPRTLDLAFYFVDIDISYEQVMSLFLSNEDSGWDLSSVEKIFFLYQYICLHALNSIAIPEEDVLAAFTNCVRPATIEIYRLIDAGATMDSKSQQIFAHYTQELEKLQGDILTLKDNLRISNEKVHLLQQENNDLKAELKTVRVLHKRAETQVQNWRRISKQRKNARGRRQTTRNRWYHRVFRRRSQQS